jgi:glycosyltransferase involved in cell wall biosynthesis
MNASFNSKIKVSIVVPIFNPNKVLFTKTINALLQQTLKDIEIILVDDASTSQRTADILNKYKAHSNIKIITHQVNKHVGGACNTGMGIAKGEFIAFCAQDDYMEKDMYQLLYQKAIKDNADIVICGIQRISDSGMVLGKRKLSADIKFNTITQDKIYRRSMLKRHKLSFIENIVPEDWFNSLCMMYSNKTSIVDKILFSYVQHEGSLVANQKSWINQALVSENYFFKECKSRGLLEKYRDEVKYLYFYRYLWDGYKSILKYEKNSLDVLQKMLKHLESNNITIHDKVIKKNLHKRLWRQLWILTNYPILFRFFIFVKYHKYEKSRIVDYKKITQTMME